MVLRDRRRQTAQQLAGALAVTGIKQSSGGLLMPDRNNRNQLLWWESSHLPCQLQPGMAEGRDGRACLGRDAAALPPGLQPHCVLVWCPCFTTFQWLLVGERSEERKTINVACLCVCTPWKLCWYQFCLLQTKCPVEASGSWCPMCVVLHIHFSFLCCHSMHFLSGNLIFSLNLTLLWTLCSSRVLVWACQTKSKAVAF